MRIVSLVILALFAFSIQGRAEPSPTEIQDYLEQYIGSWVGEISFETTQGEVLQTLTVASEYWKSGSSTKGLTAFEIDGEMKFAESKSYLRNQRLFSDVTQEGETVTYRGFFRDGGVVWIPYDMELNTERRLAERFAEEGGETVLYVDGQELLRSEKGTAKILLKARLVRR